MQCFVTPPPLPPTPSPVHSRLELNGERCKSVKRADYFVTVKNYEHFWVHLLLFYQFLEPNENIWEHKLKLRTSEVFYGQWLPWFLILTPLRRSLYENFIVLVHQPTEHYTLDAFFWWFQLFLRWICCQGRTYLQAKYLLLPTLSGIKTGVKVSQGELYVGGKFNHQRLKLVTFPILNLGFR